MKVELVNAKDVFKDENDGYIYGIIEVSNTIGYVEWFKTEEERELTIKQNKMDVI